MQTLQRKNTGFTLIEIVVVLAILGLLLVGGLNIAGSLRVNLGLKETASVSKNISEALMLFLSRNDRLPCPADPTLASTNANYALEDVDELPCEADQQIGGTGVYWGTVPYRTLGIEPGKHADAWNNQFYYVVNGGAAAQNSLSAGRWDANNAIQLWNKAADDATAPAPVQSVANGVYALISAGPNGSGAYNLDGTQRAVPPATSLDELENIDADISLTSAPFSDSTTRPFDDIVTVFTEDQIMANLVQSGSTKTKRAITDETLERILQALIGSAATDNVDPDGATRYSLAATDTSYQPPCILGPAAVVASSGPPATFHYACDEGLRTARRNIPFSDADGDGSENAGSNAERGVPFNDIGLGANDVIDAWGNPINYDPGDTASLETALGGIYSGNNEAVAISLRSFGPNGLDDGGGGDDIVITRSAAEILANLAGAGISVD